VTIRGVYHFFTKLVAIATSLDRSSAPKTLSFGEKITKMDPEIIVLQAIIKKEIKKKEINASRIYSPSGRFAEQAKN